MGYRSRTQIGRTPEESVSLISKEDISRIERCNIGMVTEKTICDVFLDGNFIGQGRYTMSCQMHRKSKSEEWIVSGFDWETSDPLFCLAILELIKSK